MSATSFEKFLQNLIVKNPDDISGRYKAITKRLNKDYWNTEQDYQNCLQVGSYGRNTAIDGVSDLDMAFELPWTVHDRFNNRQGNIQSQLLNEIRDCLKVLYPTTPIKADGQVVAVQFKNYRVEILPSFVEQDNGYKFPDSNANGSWRWCWPRDEMKAVQDVQDRTNGHLKKVCKMLRAWKNHQGAPMSGMLIDTLAHNYFKSTTKYDDKGFASYPELVRDVFTYLADQPEQEYWLAPGSKDRVYPKGKFQPKAKKAAKRCQEALDAENDSEKESLWKKVFGRPFPRISITQKSAYSEAVAFNNTAEFIEDLYPVDTQHEIRIECEESYQGSDVRRLKWLEHIFPIRLGRSLKFQISYCSVPQPYALFWKVRNVGPVAEKRGIRGQIKPDSGHNTLIEKTDFPGPHYVECYVIKDGVCVARDLFDVPIGDA
jgi:Second Messenger Oligonucleotide or Dinucleotide Synthetase domain/Adenylyl/Guanylyl and SMODS C-terminal sensor domain